MIMAKDWLKVGALFCVSILFVMLAYRRPFLSPAFAPASHLSPVFALLYAIWIYVVVIVSPVAIPGMLTFSWLRGRPVFVRAAVSAVVMFSMIVAIDFAG